MIVQEILIRLFQPRGRIHARFGEEGRLRRRGMVRTSGAPRTRAASPKMIREYVGQTVGAWDNSGDQGRAELDDIMRRSGY